MITRFILFLLFSGLSLGLFAQSLEQLPREKSKALKSNWEVVPSLKTIPLNKYKGDNSQVHHKTPDQVFLKKLRSAKQPLLSTDSDEESLVVYNPKRKMTGSVSGAIILTLKDTSTFQSVLNDYPLKKIRLDRNIGLAIVKVKKGFDIEKIYNNLKSDSRVNNAEIEVVSARMLPR